MCLGMCGLAKYSAIESMGVKQRCEAMIAEYLGKASIDDVVAGAAPKVERYMPTGSSAPAAFLACWEKMDGLEHVVGFPTWEEDVFNLLAAAYGDLEQLFAYYSGDSPGMQQAELVDLAMDNKMATKAYPITKIVALFEGINAASGTSDADFEMHEFLTFLVHLAFDRDGPQPTALEKLLGGLSRSSAITALTSTFELVKTDDEIAGALAAGAATVTAAAGGASTVSERPLLQYLETAKQIRSVIVTLKDGSDGSTDLTWQDASAAYQLCGGGSPLSADALGQCLALCGMVKYSGIEALSPAQKVEGFLANLAGSKDEMAIIGA